MAQMGDSGLFLWTYPGIWKFKAHLIFWALKLENKPIEVFLGIKASFPGLYVVVHSDLWLYQFGSSSFVLLFHSLEPQVNIKHLNNGDKIGLVMMYTKV